MGVLLLGFVWQPLTHHTHHKQNTGDLPGILFFFFFLTEKKRKKKKTFHSYIPYKKKSRLLVESKMIVLFLSDNRCHRQENGAFIQSVTFKNAIRFHRHWYRVFICLALFTALCSWYKTNVLTIDSPLPTVNFYWYLGLSKHIVILWCTIKGQAVESLHWNSVAY